VATAFRRIYCLRLQCITLKIIVLQDRRRNLGRQTFSLLDSRIINRKLKKKSKVTLTRKTRSILIRYSSVLNTGRKSVKIVL
jgi:hypothetical protein